MLVGRKNKCYVHCPVCGGYLIKSSASNSEVECRRCHHVISVVVNDGMVTVYEKQEGNTGMQGRVAVYQENSQRYTMGRQVKKQVI